MSSFKGILKSHQTIFSNPDALDPDFIPKLLPHRENQQKHIATCINPLFQDRQGKHLLIKGASGIGKTAATKRVLMDLSEETEEIIPVYVNCWNKNTSYKILTAIANALRYKFTHNMSTDEIQNRIQELSENFKGVVYVFDEIDKAEDLDFIYFLLEEPAKKVLIMITSDLIWGDDVDHRVMSRLLPESICFNPYNETETRDILKERIKYAFYEDVWDEDAFNLVANKAAQFKDIRVGIMLLKSAGETAEIDSSKKINLKHADKALSKTNEIKIKASCEITDEEKQILDLCNEQKESFIGELYASYQSVSGDKSDRTFRRKLDGLARRGLIELKLESDGVQGRRTRVIFKGFSKTLDDFGEFKSANKKNT